MTKNTTLDLMRDSATVFPQIEYLSDLRSLRIWHCKYKSLQPLAACLNLEELVIGSLPEKTLEFLVPLRNLRYLSILHMPKVHELEALSGLKNVESLSLSTSPAWDAAQKCLVVESLEPIVKMPALRHLELFGVCPQDKSLSILEQCKSLESARFSQYPKNEVERYYAASQVKNQFIPQASFS